MIHGQNTKKVALEPASYTNGASATLTIDRLGYDYATVDVILGSANVVSNVPSVLKITEGDTTSAVTTAISAFATTALQPTAVGTNSVTIVTANIDCRNRKRYLGLTVSPATTEVISAIANLSRPAQAPTSTTNANVSVLVNG